MPGLVGGAVMTVTGSVAPGTLGLTLPREHLISDFIPKHDTPEAWAVAKAPRPVAAADCHRYEAPLTMELVGPVTLGMPNRDNWRLDDEATAIGEALDFAGWDGRTIIDVSSIGLGRDPAGLRRVAVATGLNVVMGCGWYHPAWTAGIAERDIDDLADEMVRDLTIGVDGIRAGVIGELAALDPAVPAERRLLAAAARAARTTGAPIALSRSADAATQREVLALLAEEGVELSRVSIGHCDGLAPDLPALLDLLALGVYICFDRLGRLPTVYSAADDQDVAATVVALAERGHVERILLSHDVSAKHELRAFGGGGYAYLPRQFFWLLQTFGGESLTQTVTAENPRRWLTTPAPEVPR